MADTTLELIKKLRAQLPPEAMEQLDELEGLAVDGMEDMPMDESLPEDEPMSDDEDDLEVSQAVPMAYEDGIEEEEDTVVPPRKSKKPARKSFFS